MLADGREAPGLRLASLGLAYFSLPAGRCGVSRRPAAPTACGPDGPHLAPADRMVRT